MVSKLPAKKVMKPSKPKVVKADMKEVKENMRDIKEGLKTASKDTSARANNYNKEQRYKPGALHEELGSGGGRNIKKGVR